MPGEENDPSASKSNSSSNSIESSGKSPRNSDDKTSNHHEPSPTPVPPPLPSRSLVPSTPALAMGTMSPVIPFLRRLTFILSLLLGSAAVGAWLWSTFLLPLLHASFSARKVLVEQQTDRVQNLIRVLRGIRSRKIYPITKAVATSIRSDKTPHIPSPSKGGKDAEGHGHDDHPSLASRIDDEDQQHKEIASRRLLIEEIEDSSSLRSIPVDPISSSDRLSFPPDLEGLKSRLRALSTALDSTSTTRTSLLSTLEMFTSDLHREVYRRSWSSTQHHPGVGSGRSGFGSVGLGTLSANLDRESGKGFGGGDERDEAFENARKEIRAMKGLLLGRRNFAHAQTHPHSHVQSVSSDPA